MKKLLLFRALALVACLTLAMGVQAANDYDFVEDNLQYVITSSTTVKVVGVNVASPSGTWSIPATTDNGYKVTRIAENAFSNYSGITTIQIGSNVNTIEPSAFNGCTGLTKVTIYDLAAWCNITISGNAQSNPLYYAHHLYLGNTEVTNLTIPNGVQNLSDLLFYGCYGLTSVTIPNSVTSIGWACFNRCSNLKTVTIGSGVTKITNFAFGNCNALTSVTCLAATPPTILNSNAFDDATYSGVPLTVPKSCKSAYESATYWSNFTTIKEAPYNFVYNGIYYSITGDNTVEVTYKDTNYNSYSGNVSIPRTVVYNGTTYQVTSIGQYAFNKSTGLTSVTLPQSIAKMGPYAFDHCSGLTRVNISNLAAWCNITFQSSASSNPLCYGHHLYLNGTEVTDLTVPSGVQQLAQFVFYGCEGLTSVTIPNSVTSIGWSCFSGCTNLKTVNLGSGLTSIANYAFAGSTTLTSLTCLATTPPTMSASTVFTDATYSGASLTVPKDHLSDYQSANYWSNFSSILEAPYNFMVDGIYYKITGSNTVEVTYKDSNYNSYSGSVNIPSSVTFNGTNYQVTAIGNHAFSQSENLTSVTIPPTVTLIDTEAFGYCSGLTRVNISNLAAWCKISFKGNAWSNPLYYAHHLYLNGTEVTDLTIPSEIVTLDTFIFYGCDGLTTVTIPDNVTSIGWSCFAHCTNLTTVTLGSGITFIDNYAFASCTSLSQITCCAITPPTIKANTTFDNNTYNNATLIVPNNCKDAYQSANYWRNFSTIEELYYTFMVNGIYYSVTGTNTVEVSLKDLDYSLTSPNLSNYTGEVNIPNNVEYKGTTYQVTAIGPMAFCYCQALTSVKIPNSVTAIRNSAFGECPALSYVAIPASVTIIEAGAFFGSGITSVTIPNSVTRVGFNAFGECTNLTSVTCLATTPPTVTNNAFNNSAFNNVTLFVPKASINTYKAADCWKNFSTVKPHLEYALNVQDETIEFTSTGDYPWTNMVDGNRVYAQSGNKGVHSSTSTLTAVIEVPNGGTLSFDYKAWGEGSNTIYDKSTFYIDGSEQFSYGELDNDWESYSTQLSPGTHILSWTYRKDYNVNSDGDYFAVDNVTLVHNTVMLGDINGDSLVDVDDVTALISAVLNGTTLSLSVADINNDGRVDVDDVTTLISRVLNGH